MIFRNSVLYFAATICIPMFGCDSSGSSNQEPHCGDGVVQQFEQCDDGNQDPYDGCHECRLWEPATGEKLALAPTDTWAYFPIEGALCRDGSQAGFSMSVGKSPEKLMFFYEGGGACFSDLSCGLNPANITEERQLPPAEGIFDRSQDRNPFKDWTFVYLPYCSGDVYAGNVTHVDAAKKAKDQYFVGYNNLQLFLNRIVPTVGAENIQHLVSSGQSAGGLASVVTAKRLIREFPDAKVTVLDDAGPPVKTDVVTECLQDIWRDMYQLDETALGDCGWGCSQEGPYLFDIARDLVASDDRIGFGFVSFMQDLQSRLTFTVGHDNCDMMPFPIIEEDVYQTSLLNFRDDMREASKKTATFYVPGDTHTCVHKDCFYETEADGVGLPEWTRQLLDGQYHNLGYTDSVEDAL